MHSYLNNLASILEKVFKKWHVSLPQKPFKYQIHTNDFGLETKSLALAKEINTRTINPIHSSLAGKTMYDGLAFLHTPKNMENISKELGFDIIKTDEFYYVRDHFLKLASGDIKIPYHSDFAELAMMRARSSNLYLNKTATTHTKNQIFNSWSGYTQSYSKILNEGQKIFHRVLGHFAYAYVEGGNVWTLTNGEGKIKVLVGSDHLVQTLHILELENRSWTELAKIAFEEPFESICENLAYGLSANDIKKYAEEMFSEGLLSYRGKTGLVDRKNQLNIILIKFVTGSNKITQEEKGWFRKFATQLGLIDSFELTEQEVLQKRSIVAEYLAKKKITHRLMAKDFGVPDENLHFIEQVNYHLDTFIRPGPKHCIFIVNFAFLADLLEAILKDKNLLGISKRDEEYLEYYIQTSKKFDEELSPLLKIVEKQLADAGFAVVPMPGHIIYESKTMYQEFPMPSGGFNMNFINALSGWSSSIQNYYYITHGMQVGDKLGEVIMDTFTLFLREYVPNIAVYFIGKDPEHLNDFSEAMDWWNRLETQSGIHCTTFEL